MPAINTEKVFFALLFLLSLSLGIVVGAYWLIFRGNSIGFLSTNPKYKWEINKQDFNKIEDIYRGNGLNSLILVEFASGFKFIEDYATGWNPDEGYVYTSEWKTRFGIPTLTIYMNEANFAKVPEDGKNLMMTLLVTQRIELLLNLPREVRDSISGDIYVNRSSAPLGVIERSL